VAAQVGAGAPLPVAVAGGSSGASVPLALAPSAPPAVVVLPLDVIQGLPDGLRLVVKLQPTPTAENSAADGSLGGGIARRLGPPIDLRVVAQDIASGGEVPLPDSILPKMVMVALPVLSEGGAPSGATDGSGPPASDGLPHGEFTWLLEVQGDDAFLGYLRLDGTFDAATNTVVYQVPVERLQGTLFLPVALEAAWVTNFDPHVRIWSSPFQDAVDFGEAAPQWTVFPVVAPQVGQRVEVLNPVTGGVGWIDVGGVGPS
jgi:hypothetical protein